MLTNTATGLWRRWDAVGKDFGGVAIFIASTQDCTQRTQTACIICWRVCVCLFMRTHDMANPKSVLREPETDNNPGRMCFVCYVCIGYVRSYPLRVMPHHVYIYVYSLLPNMSRTVWADRPFVSGLTCVFWRMFTRNAGGMRPQHRLRIDVLRRAHKDSDNERVRKRVIDTDFAQRTFLCPNALRHRQNG